jgi:hypothetical protein
MVAFPSDAAGSSQVIHTFLNELHDGPLQISVECRYLPNSTFLLYTRSCAELYTRDAPDQTASRANSSMSRLQKLCGRTETITQAHFCFHVSKFTLLASPERNMESDLLMQVCRRALFGKPVYLGNASCSITTTNHRFSTRSIKVLRMDLSINVKNDSRIILAGDM